MRKISFVLIILALITVLLPSVAFAADELDVVAWASPDSVSDGEQTTIYIQIGNFTGKKVMLTSYGVDNDFFQIGEGTYLDNNQTTVIEHVYDVSFGQNNSIAIPVQVNYDDGAGGVVVSFSDQVQIYKESSSSVDFIVTPDANGIEPGSFVNFTIECTNTGSFDYTGFTVTANGADYQTFDLATGQSQTVIFSESYFQDTMQSFGYYFFYNGGMSKKVIPAFTTKITVLTAETATQQPVGDDSPSSSSTNTPGNADTANEPPQDEPLQEDAFDEPEPQDNPDEQSQITEPQNKDEDNKPVENNTSDKSQIGTLAIILITVGAVLVIAVIVLSTILAKRKKQIK